MTTPIKTLIKRVGGPANFARFFNAPINTIAKYNQENGRNLPPWIVGALDELYEMKVDANGSSLRMKTETTKTAEQRDIVQPLVSNWSDMMKICAYRNRRDTYSSCSHKDIDPTLICSVPSSCPMVKAWAKCNINDKSC